MQQRWQGDSAHGTGLNGDARRSELPFRAEDVPTEMLRHPYWDLGGPSPYDWIDLLPEEGESPANLKFIFDDDAGLLSGEYLR